MDQHITFEKDQQSPASQRGHRRHVRTARPQKAVAGGTDAQFDEVWEELYPLTYDDDNDIRAWAWSEVEDLQRQHEDPSWVPELVEITLRTLVKVEDAAPGLRARIGALMRALRKP